MSADFGQSTIVQITDAEFKKLISFVYDKYGIDLSKKRQLIEGRLARTLKEKDVNSFAQYMDILFKDNTGEEMHHFLNKITTNHSYFARENDHFEYLMNTALPFLEKRRHGDLRIWSAGCSAGQEPYNIAMAVDQYFGPRKSQWDATILATDISTKVLGQAKQGVYPEDNLKGLPPTWKRNYFTDLGNGSLQVKEHIRKEVVFRTFNLMDPIVYKKPFDIIFCRNVMIYFDGPTTQKLVQRFYEATAPGGYLFIGHSESINKYSTNYTYLQPAIYQKLPKGGGKL